MGRRNRRPHTCLKPVPVAERAHTVLGGSGSWLRSVMAKVGHRADFLDDALALIHNAARRRVYCFRRSILVRTECRRVLQPGSRASCLNGKNILIIVSLPLHDHRTSSVTLISNDHHHHIHMYIIA